ncbi:ATP-binding protein [Thiohalobacter sp. IOR34]|uniref:ATP-binding protein n=1 Tax=Thiohalobacter sp. IOR34 TaxID=3057176 RepID=UPI0025B166C7|nr:ATP-binding protein [Thiohalobacter sp. IOR34]WJW74629.1 ATP-binding protein [Thiohalobacter sp. IOR34]
MKDEAERGLPLHYRFEAVAEGLGGLRERLREALGAAGLDGQQVERLVLAVNEACMNIIQHGYHGRRGETIELAVEQRAGRLEFRLLDRAAPVLAEAIRPRRLDELRPGGLGVHFMREIMDEIEYLPRQEGPGNLLRMSIELKERM